MEWNELLTDGYERIQGSLEHVVEGLKEDDLNWQPEPDSNSIGWLAWHLTRQHDAQVASLLDEEQLWVKDGWAAKFNMPADPENIGFGHTTDQVQAFRSPPALVLVDYHKAVLERTKSYFKTLSGTDLDRVLQEPWFQPLPTVGVRLISIMDDAMLHAGMAAYLRGLRQGKGWQTY
ncbi:DinB family protein [Chloroflexota bacterium]